MPSGSVAIGFASIAGGAPSSVAAMTDHLRAQTLSREQADIARYYARGMDPGTPEEREIQALAQLVADGDLTYSQAHDALMVSHLRRGGDLDDATKDRLGKKLADAALRIEMGAEKPVGGEPRRDMHPLVAKGLGIDPDLPLDRERINALLAGRRADGKKIAGKTYAKVRRLPLNPKTGERELSLPIGSYDFCPSPDKSVSVAWAFAEPAEQAMIYNAHIEAARAAVAYIAMEIGQARTGKGGEGELIPGHVGWLEFTHFTARRTQFTVADGVAKFTPDASVAGDPDLHTHFLIPNAVFCENGRVGSLHTARIAGFLFEAGAYYHARLAQNLRDAGFAAELDHSTGAAVMTAIPRDVCDLFSKRTKAGELLAKQFTADRRENWDELSPAQQSARIKRATQDLDQKVKGGKDDVANIADWKRQAKEALGWEPSSFLAYGPPALELAREARLEMAYETALPFLAERLEQKSTVPHFDLRVAAGRGLLHAGIKELSDIDAVTRLMREHGVEQYGERTALVWGQEEGRRFVSVTTELHESQEQEFIRLAKAAAQDKSGALPRDALDRKISESGLDFSGEHGKGQLAMIHRLGTGGRFGVAIAAAGAGKTAALQPLVAAWQEQGRRVYGASLAWRQADDLTEAGIAQRDVKAFSVLLAAARAGELELDRSAVVAVDEFALLGTRQGLELLRFREKHEFSIVALGDPKQCAAIEAGNIVALARRALGTEQIPEIVTTLRQETAREREIVGLFREGRAKEALDMKRADGAAEMVFGGYNETVARVAKLYAERLQATGEAPTVSTPINADAHKISETIRAERRALGLLGPDVKRVQAVDPDGRKYDMALAVGDRIRLFKSTRARFTDGRRGGSIGRNGSVLEIRDIGEDEITVRNRKTGREGRVAWRSLTTKTGVLLAYGDVLTVNTAQGMTSAEHIYALPSGSKAVSGLQAYTAGTRHRQRAYLVTSEIAERSEIRNRRPLNDAREITVDDKWANVARNFSYQPEKDIAVEMLERAEKIRRGSVRLFPQRLQPAEQRILHGEPPSHIHETGMRRRTEKALAPVIERIVGYARELRQRIMPSRQAQRDPARNAQRSQAHDTAQQREQSYTQGRGMSR